MEHRQIVRQSAPAPEAPNPWQGEELKHFWALANSVFGPKQATGRVYDVISIRYKKGKLHELDRSEFAGLLAELHIRAQGNLDAQFRGTPMAGPWRKIRWLQRELDWSDQKLINYILWHGRKTGRAVDSINWLTVDKSRAIITGMHKMRARSRVGK